MPRICKRDLIVVLRGRILHGNFGGCNACWVIIYVNFIFSIKFNMLRHVHTTIYMDVFACNVGCAITSQEFNRIRDLFWLP